MDFRSGCLRELPVLVTRVMAKNTAPQHEAHAESHPGSARARIPAAYLARLGFVFPPDELRATAARMRALNARASISSPSRMSIARLVLPWRLELKSPAGSFNEAPL